jgi:hypothetical protein
MKNFNGKAICQKKIKLPERRDSDDTERNLNT